MNSGNRSTLLRFFAAAFCAVGSWAVMLWLFLELAEPFGSDIYRTLSELLAQTTMIVATYFLAAITIFADRLGFRRVSRLTAGFAGIVLIHFAITRWVSFHPNLDRNSKPLSVLYMWSSFSFMLGLIVWWRIRRTETTKTIDGRSSPQFTLGSSLIWLTLFGVLVSTFTQGLPLEALLHPRVFRSLEIEQIVCAIFILIVALPLTRFLIRVRRFVVAIAGAWIVLFSLSWITFGVIGLQESEYDHRDGWILRIAAFSFAVMLYLAWIAIVRFVLRRSSAWRVVELPLRFPRLRKIGLATFSIAAIGLWCFLLVWFVFNFLTFSSRRQLAYFDSSPVILEELKKAYGAKVFEDERAKHASGSLLELVNGLGRERVPKENDLLYQVAALSRFTYLDHPKAKGVRRRVMGFTEKQVAALSDETFEGWLRANRTDIAIASAVNFEGDDDDPKKIDAFEFEIRTTHAPWDETTSSLSARFCREKQPLFHRLRVVVSECDDSFVPRLEGGFMDSSEISSFVSTMLLADARYAMSMHDLQLALRNLDAISKLANSLSFDSSGWAFDKQRIQARAMEFLIHIVETKSLSEVDRTSIEGIAKKLNQRFNPSEIDEANRFVFELLQHRTEMSAREDKKNYLLLGRRPIARLISVCPQVIDWGAYIDVRKEEFARFCKLRKHARWDESQFTRLLNIANAPRKDEWQFHEQAMHLFDFPANRSKRIAETVDDFSLPLLRIQVLFAARAKLRRVALELLMYRSEHGTFPRDLTQLKSSVQDPFSKEPLIYRESGRRFELYSVGPNAIDDGGVRDLPDDILFVWPEATMEEYLDNN